MKSSGVGNPSPLKPTSQPKVTIIDPVMSLRGLVRHLYLLILSILKKVTPPLTCLRLFMMLVAFLLSLPKAEI